MDTCPTVKIVSDNDQGFIVINESDFDAEKHVLYGDDQPARKQRKSGDSK